MHGGNDAYSVNELPPQKIERTQAQYCFDVYPYLSFVKRFRDAY